MDATGLSQPFTIAGQPTIIDAGLVDLVYLHGPVFGSLWIDANRDGLRDQGESQVPPPVTVELVAVASGAVVRSLTTENGFYDFGLQLPGTYRVRMQLPPGFAFTSPYAGPDPWRDSDVDAAGLSQPFTIAGQHTIIEAGLVDLVYLNGPVFGSLWIDANRDGLRDQGEALGPAPVTVELVAVASGAVVRSLTTENGFYDFGLQLPGTYRVRMLLPPGFAFTSPHVGPDPWRDSDVDAAGLSQPFTIAGQHTIIEAGCVDQQGQVFGMVWVDTDRDGVRDPGVASSPGLVSVDLVASDTGEVVATRTMTEGFYDFGLQLPGTYQVRFRLPPGFAFTFQHVGTDGWRDSDVDETGFSDKFVIAGLPQIIEAGCLDQHGSVVGTVWLDANRNGMRDPALEVQSPAGVKVDLVEVASGVVVGSQAVANGFYDFGSQLPGTYVVQVRLPAGFAPTTPGVGGPMLDSDVDAAGRSAPLLIAGGDHMVDIGVVEVPPPLAISINFQPANATVPAGFLVDAGAVFANRGNGRSYGWNLVNAHTRERNSPVAPDQRWDTLNHLQKESGRRWELALPAGWYEVTVGCGDPSYTDQINTLQIEGLIARDTDGYDRFDTHTVLVEVRDGRLTIAPAVSAGAVNAKITFVEVVAVPAGNG